MKILFVTATRIGDAVLSTGLLSHLLERHPGARVTIAAGPAAAPLFEGAPGLDRIIVVDKRKRGLHWWTLYRKVALHRWDLVVDLRGSALAYFLWTGRRRIAGRGDKSEHRVRELGRLVGLDPPPSPRLWTLPRHESAAAALIPPGPPVLAIGPAANWRAKTWRAERFAELARRLTGAGGLFAGARVAVMAAAHERAQAAPVLAEIPAERRLDLVGRTDLLTAAAALRRAALYVGNDTGLTHIAAAMGTPTLALFGPSPAQRFAPWGPRAATVQTPLTHAQLTAAPGFNYLTADTLMDGIEVGAVETAVCALLESLTRPRPRDARATRKRPRETPPMALIVMADDGVAFDGATREARPLGGAEAAFLALAEALARRGHGVMVRNICAAPVTRNGVDWRPLAAGIPDTSDLYIANRGHRLIGLAPKARSRAFWLHNPGGYILKPRYLWPLFVHRPVLVFSGAFHASTVPAWVPCAGRAIIPYGLDAAYRSASARGDTPPPVAIFTSNPLRGLDWLLDLWERRIRPAVPAAELHVYAGPQVYGAVGERKAAEMAKVLARAEALAPLGVRRHAPVPKAQLIPPLRSARAMLYRGDIGESFCLAVAEAQALGLPAVVTKLASLPERVVDGVTGTVARDDDHFCTAAVAILTDDALWRRQHAAALEHQRGIGWDEAAAHFEALIP